MSCSQKHALLLEGLPLVQVVAVSVHPATAKEQAARSWTLDLMGGGGGDLRNMREERRCGLRTVLPRHAVVAGRCGAGPEHRRPLL